MKDKSILSGLVIALAVTAGAQGHLRAESPYPGYTLAYDQDFNYPTEDLQKYFRFETGYKRNHEAQYYANRPENAYTENGNLVIEARTGETVDGEWRSYTSASLQSKKTFHYGIWETRAKIPVGDGVWPAIWGTGNTRDWPQAGELDIMEYYGNALHANFACGTSSASPKWSSAWPAMWNFNNNYGQDADWHIWRCEWDHNTIRIYVDDHLLNQMDLADAMMCNEDGYNPWTDPNNGFQVWLNLALGGDHGGSLDNFTGAKYYIDYTRVYTPDSYKSPLVYMIAKAERIRRQRGNGSADLQTAIETAKSGLATLPDNLDDNSQAAVDALLDALQAAMTRAGDGSSLTNPILTRIEPGKAFRLNLADNENLKLWSGWWENTNTMGCWSDGSSWNGMNDTFYLEVAPKSSDSGALGYNIRTADGHYIGLADNGWDMVWTDTPSLTDPAYMFATEGWYDSGKTYVRLKNVKSAKYVGCDSHDEWAHVYGDKTGENSQSIVWVLDGALAPEYQNIGLDKEFYFESVAYPGCFMTLTDGAAGADCFSLARVTDTNGYTDAQRTFTVTQSPDGKAYNIRNRNGQYLFRFNWEGNTWTLRTCTDENELNSDCGKFYPEKFADDSEYICFRSAFAPEGEPDRHYVGVNGDGSMTLYGDKVNWTDGHRNDCVAFIPRDVKTFQTSTPLEGNRVKFLNVATGKYLSSDAAAPYQLVLADENATGLNQGFTVVKSPDGKSFNLMTDDGYYLLRAYGADDTWTMTLTRDPGERCMPGCLFTFARAPGSGLLIQNAASGTANNLGADANMQVYGNKDADFGTAGFLAMGSKPNYIGGYLRNTVTGYYLGMHEYATGDGGYAYDDENRLALKSDDRKQWYIHFEETEGGYYMRLNDSYVGLADGDANKVVFSDTWPGDKVANYLFMPEGAPYGKYVIRSMQTGKYLGTLADWVEDTDGFGFDKEAAFAITANPSRALDYTPNYFAYFDMVGAEPNDRGVDLEALKHNIKHWLKGQYLCGGYHTDWGGTDTNVRNVLLLCPGTSTTDLKYAYDFRVHNRYRINDFNGNETDVVNLFVEAFDREHTGEVSYAFRTWCPKHNHFEVHLARVSCGLEEDPNFNFVFHRNVVNIDDKDLALAARNGSRIEIRRHTLISNEGARAQKGEENMYLYMRKYATYADGDENRDTDHSTPSGDDDDKGYYHVDADSTGQPDKDCYFEVNTVTWDPTGIEQVCADPAFDPAAVTGVFNLQGIRIADTLDALGTPSGRTYIVLCGGRALKVMY